MKKKILVILLVLVMAAMITSMLFACSPRNTEEARPDDDIQKGIMIDKDEEIRQIDRMSRIDAKNLLQETIDNYHLANQPAGDDAEWFIVDVTASFAYDFFGVNEERAKDVTVGVTLDLKANFNLLNNAKSELFLEIRDDIYGKVVIGVYYFDRTLYANVAGKEYFTRELNLTTIGNMLADALGASNIDVAMIMAGIMGDRTGIEMIDSLLPLIQGILFSSDGSSVTQYNVDANGQFLNKDIAFPIEILTILGFLKTGIPIVDIKIAWDAFGLPNFDPLMRQLIGFGLEDIVNYDWPDDMNTYFTAVTTRQNVTYIDPTFNEERNEDLFVFEGMSINVDTTESVKDARMNYGSLTPADVQADPEKEIEEFTVDIKISPVQLKKSYKKRYIDFGPYQLGSKYQNIRYAEAGLANLGVNLGLQVEADANSQITINDILGDLLNTDLGALGNMPIKFPYQTKYEFVVDLKVALDFFNSMKTTAEATILLNGRPVIRVYIGENVLYLNFDELKALSGQVLPNVKIVGFSINNFLSSIMPKLEPYLNPDYIPPAEEVVPESGPMFAEGEEEAGSSFDVMGLLHVLIPKITVPGRDKSLEKWIISLDLDNEDINGLVSMFLPPPSTDPDAPPSTIREGGKLGIHSIRFEIDQKDPLRSIKLKVLLGADGEGENLTNKVGLGISVNSFTYFATPKWDNYEMVNTPGKRESYTNITAFRNPITGDVTSFQSDFNLLLSGDLTLGMQQTSETGIDLSEMIGAFIENVLLSIGVQESKNIKIAYRIKANINILRLDRIELKLDIFNPDNPDVNYISLFYSGEEDTLYIDLESLHNIRDQLPVLDSLIGRLPKLKYSNLGLKDTLRGIDIVDILSGLVGGGDTPNNGPSNSLLGIEIDPTNELGVVGAFLDGVKLWFAHQILPLAFGDPSDEMLAAGLNLANIFNAEGEEAAGEEGGLDILAVLGAMLSKVEVDSHAHTLSVILATNALSALMVILNQPFSLPDISGHIKIQLLNLNYQTDEHGNRYLEDGYLTIYLALLDSGNSEIHALSLEIDILKDIGIKIGQTSLFGANERFDSSEYTELMDFVDTLKLGVKLSGFFKLYPDEGVDNYVNDYINEALAGLVEGIALKFGLEEFGLNLGYEIMGNVDIANLAASEAMIRLFDRDTLDTILGIYLLNGNVYLQLDYFGIPSFGITNLERLIEDIKALTAAGEPDIPEPEALPSLFNLHNVVNGPVLSASPEAVAIKVILAPDSLSVTLAKEAIAALLAILLKSELPVAVKDTYVGLGFGAEGLTFEIKTGVEVLNLHIKIEDVRINVMGDELFEIRLPENVTFHMSTEGMPDIVYVALGGYLKVHSDTIEGVVNSDGIPYNLISLTPALEGLLPDLDLDVVIEFLGLVDATLFFTIEAGVCIDEIIALAGGIDEGFSLENLTRTSLSIQLSTYANEDPNVLEQDPITGKMIRPKKAVAAIKYIDGDLFIHAHTFLLNIERIYIPNAAAMITELIETLSTNTDTDDETTPAAISSDFIQVFGGSNEGSSEISEETLGALAYINLMFKEHGLAVTITKSTLVGLLESLLGADISSYIGHLDVYAEVGLSSKPLEVYLDLGVKQLGAEFFTLGLSVDMLRIVPEFKVTMSADEKATYREVTSLSTIGASISGALTMKIMAPANETDPATCDS